MHKGNIPQVIGAVGKHIPSGDIEMPYMIVICRLQEESDCIILEYGFADSAFPLMYKILIPPM